MKSLLLGTDRQTQTLTAIINRKLSKLVTCSQVEATGILLSTKDANLVFQGVLTDQQTCMISNRFPEDIFTKIQQNLQFYRHLPGMVNNPWMTLILFTQAIAQLKDIYRALIAQCQLILVYCKMFYWYNVKYKNFESARKFPGDYANFQ